MNELKESLTQLQFDGLKKDAGKLLEKISFVFETE